MNNRTPGLSLIVARSFAVLFLCAGADLAAQKEAPSPKEAGLQELKDAIFSKLEAVKRTINEEVAANRLDSNEASIALSPVDFVLDSSIPKDVSSAIFFGKEHEKTKNARVQKAWSEFDAAVVAWTEFVEKKLPKVIESKLIEAANAWRKAKSSVELSGSIASLQGLQEIVDNLIDSPTHDRAGQLREAVDFLVKSKELFAAEESGEVELIARASNALVHVRRAFSDQLSLKEMEERRVATVRKLRAEAVALGKEGIEGLPNAKRPEEVAALVQKLAQASLIEATTTNRVSGTWNERFDRQLELAKDWQRMIELESTGALKEAADLARSMRPRAVESAPALAAILSRRAETLGHSEWEAAEKRKTVLESDFSTQLTTLKDAKGALTLVGKTRAAAGEEFLRSADGRPLMEALNELESIGRFWQAVETQSGATIAALNQRSQAPHPWQTQLAALTDRIRRDHLSARLEAPELLKPPLNSLPLAEAVETLTQEAVRSNNWHRVHGLLEAQASLGRKEAIQEDLAAVRAFIAGENFEKAQLFADAVSSYKAVLRSVGRRSPLELAGNRLKALKVEHPELFQTSGK